MAGTDNKGYWDFPADPRDKGMQYPNYNILGSASGHNITIDDSKGAESLTINHASGSAFQFHPDGSVAIKANGKKYEMIVGDNHIVITGQMDVTVNGPKTVKVEGDYVLNVTGNMKTVVEGNMETLVAGNYGEHIEGNKSSTVSGNKSTYVSGSIMQASTDRTYIVSKSGMKLQTTGGHMYFQSSSTMKSFASGAMAHQSGGAMTVKSGSTYAMSSQSKATFYAAGGDMGLDAPNIFLNSGVAGEAGNA